MSDNGFRFGDWQINPDSNTLCQGTTTTTVEPKAMDVLRYLCRHPGAVIPPEELLQACWGNAELGDNPIHKAITQLRRALGDSASDPRYIETVRKRGYRAIAPVMAAEDLQEGSWQQGSPFRGLESFQESHASIFFGRMQATAQLRELVLNRASEGSAMALVLGPSGSGKTSLVRAGLLPRLMASRTGSGEPVALACTLYMDCADLADGNLFQALAAVLMDAEIDSKLVFAGENAEGLGRWLESSDAAAIAGRLEEFAGRIKIGLFVDRLEAIFRAPGVTDEIRARFIAVLEYLAGSRAVLVMLACRNDFYPEVIALPALMALKARGGHFDLNPPDGAEIAQMVRMPAKAAGLKFEVDPSTGASLDDVLCDAARGSPDTLPLLQYCLNELYRQRSEDGTLLFEVFRQLGGIEGAIAVRAEQVVSGLSAAQMGALPQVLSLIVDVTEEQGTVTARRVAWSALPNSEARELVQALVEARLFVSELNGDVPSIGMAHEALLRRWPRVSEWIEQHRHALLVRTRINMDIERWLGAGRPRDMLLPKGSQANQAKSLLELKGFTLSDLEIEFIKLSLRRVQFGEKLKLAAVILICILAIAAIFLGLFAHQAQENAEAHRNEAEGLMGYMLGDFTEKLRPLGQLDLLDGVSNKALIYLTKTPLTDTTETALLQRAKALQVIAEVNISKSNPEKASEALFLSRNILQQLEKPALISPSFLKISGTNSFWLAQIHLNKYEWNKAEYYFTEYLNYSKRLTNLSPSEADSWAEQAYAHNNIGAVSVSKGNYGNAIVEFESAIKLMQESLRLSPSNKKHQADLAHITSWLASAKARQGILKEAMALFKKEHQMLDELLRDDSNNQLFKRRLGLALWKEGDLAIALGNRSTGVQLLTEAERIHSTLASIDPRNYQWQINANQISLKIAEAGIGTLPPDQLLNELLSIKKNLENIIMLDPKRSEVKRFIASAERNLSMINLQLKNYRDSKEQIDSAVTELQSMYNADKKNQLFSVDLSIALLDKSEYELEMDEHEEAKSTCQMAVNILLPFAESTSDYKILAPIARAYVCAKNEKAAKPYIDRLQAMSYNEDRHSRQIAIHLQRKTNS